MQKKTFDPRSSKVTNPFVQAYLEKQTEKAKPIGDRQKIVNILLAMALLVNFGMAGVLIWSSRSSIIPEITGVIDHNEAMGDAVARIKQLEISLQNMRTSVEYHKNAYYKLEQEHESMKAAIARAVPPENMKEILSNYPSQTSFASPMSPPIDPQKSDDAVKSARDAAVAAQQAPSANGQ